MYHSICKRLHNARIIEIGSYEGLSLSYIKDTITTNGNQIWAVDIQARKRLVENTTRWGINFIHADSISASKGFPDGFFDVVFIDGNHSYRAVRADILAWMAKIKRYGILMGHDYDRHWPGVVRAVNELVPYKKTKGRMWVRSGMI